VPKIIIMRGLKANLPVLSVGEPAFCTDTNEYAIGSSTGNIFYSAIGPAGKSAYQLWIDAGNTGSLQSFLNSLKGLDGAAGATGPQGLQGLQGVAGLTGPAGAVGATGPQGPAGPAGSGGGGSAIIGFDKFTIKDSWSTTGVHPTPANMDTFYINNTGTADLTFTINSITETLKPNEEFLDNYDQFSQVTVTSTSTFDAKVGVGIAAPTKTIKDAFSGSANITKTTSGSVVVISNDGSSALSLVVNSITISVAAGDVKEYVFDPFTQVTVNTTVPFRAYVKGTPGVAVDTTPPVVTATPAAGTYTSTQSVTLSANETATIYYTTDGSTPTTSSAVYSTPISVPATATLKFFGKDTAGNSSTVQTAAYTINPVDTTAPNPITGLTAGTPTSSSVPLSWTISNSGDVANQEVAYSSNGGTSYTVASGVINPSSNTYTVTGLAANQAYTFRVVAIDGAGNRSTAVTTTATTSAAADTTPPEVVTNLAAGTPTSSTVPLTWTASVASDISKYEVAYSTDGTNYTIASAVVTGNSYTVTGLIASTLYTFRVASIDTSNNRSSSNPTVQATTSSATITPIVTDTFNRVDSTTSLGNADTGQTWVTDSVVWGIESNAAKGISGSNDKAVYIESGLSNCIVKAKLANAPITSTAAHRLIFRWAATGSYLFAQASATTYELWATWSKLGTATGVTPAAGDVIAVRMNGTQIVLNVNGTDVLTVTSATNQTATKHGFSAGVTDGRIKFDDFSVSALS
jgi:hypothetical protein